MYSRLSLEMSMKMYFRIYLSIFVIKKANVITIDILLAYD